MHPYDKLSYGCKLIHHFLSLIALTILASEFEGLLYNMLSEEPFANHRLYITDEKDDYTISDNVYQHFVITIIETWTCLTCQRKKNPRY